MNHQSNEILERNKQLALKFIEATDKADGAMAASILHPEAIAVSKGWSKIRGTRPRDQMIAAISMFRKLMPEGLKFNIVSVTADGDRVAVEWQGKATLANGVPYHNNYVMVFIIADGKIKQLNEYFDTLLVDEVMWPLISGSGF